MKPCSMPNRSLSTFAKGARQFVVHDALEITVCCAGSYAASLTPRQTVRSASPDGAEMTTRLAPPSRCPAAASRPVNTPVDSMTTSTPWSAHGISAGSRTSSFLTSLPSTENPPLLTFTSLRSVPPTESCLSRKAIVSLSPNGSFTATSSTPARSPRSSRARWKERPIRPYPLIPTRTVIRCASVVSAR